MNIKKLPLSEKTKLVKETHISKDHNKYIKLLQIRYEETDTQNNMTGLNKLWFIKDKELEMNIKRAPHTQSREEIISG